MPYEKQPSSVEPRLLILLTDESEESVKVINCLIDQHIELNFDGISPKNRCFIAVIGYNHNVKELCSGWLRDLDASPLRYEKNKKMISDGTGGIVEIEATNPVWVEPSSHKASSNYFTDAIIIARKIAEDWVREYALPPIVLDCSSICCTKYAIEEIKSMKSISAEDGKTLFFGCYMNEQFCNNSFFSSIPEEWEYLFPKNEFDNKTFTIKNIFSFFSAISDAAEEPGVADES